MNLLQSFMGCMYPGSIRTESIESMDHDFPDCRFQVTNIDEHGNEVSRGELQLTDRDLIYFRPSRFPTRWPIGYIRRYGCSEQKNIFLFEAGRRCPTGEAIFAFRLVQGADLVNRLREKIEKFASHEASNEHDDILMNCRLNRFTLPHQSDRSFNTPDKQINQKSNNQKVPQSSHCDQSVLISQRRKDASTSTDNQAINMNHSNPLMIEDQEGADPRPLSYALIDFDTTKALNESAQAHAASRVR